MKRTLLCVSASIALIPHPAAAQSAGGYASESVEAHADWVARAGKGRPFFRFVNVTRDSEPAKAPFTIAELGNVRCKSANDRASFMYRCVVSGRVAVISGDAFQFDAALRSARASFKAFGRSNLVEWTARGDVPEREWSLHGGERAIVASAAIRTGATVRGRVLGERFSTKRSDAHATLRKRIEAGVIHETTDDRFRVARANQAAAWNALRLAIARL